MPKVQFKRIVTFSSEDPVHVADNILVDKKWVCQKIGERSATIVIQFHHAVVINEVHIGNAHSALIEVQVNRSCTDNYEVLLNSVFMSPNDVRDKKNINQVRMFTQDKLIAPVCTEKWDQVKIICTQPYDKYVQYGLSFIRFTTHSVANSSIDLGKFAIRCNSPEIPLSQFKLKDETSKNSLTAAAYAPYGSFEEWKESKIKAGTNANSGDDKHASSLEIFKKRSLNELQLEIDSKRKKAETIDSKRKKDESSDSKRKKDDPNDSKRKKDELSESKRRNDESSESKRRNDESSESKKLTNTKEQNKVKTPKKLDEANASNDRKRNGGDGETSNKLKATSRESKQKHVDVEDSDDSKLNGHKKLIKDTNSHSKQKHCEVEASTSSKQKLNAKATTSKDEKLSGKGSSKNKRKAQKQFNKLLEGVNFVISGIQNPDRQDIREKALEMGAKYYTNWNDSSTHLICPYKNTPKCRQVKGNGKIVVPQWIFECHEERKRLPWRKFALDSDDKEEPVSEEEICEELESDANNDIRIPTSGSDTELEEERGLMTNPNNKTTGSDTEDEIERIQNLAKERPNSKLHNDTDDELTNNSTEDTERPVIIIKLYQASKEDKEKAKVRKQQILAESPSSHQKLPKLKSIFGHLTFYVESQLSNKVKFIKQYIAAYSGKISTDLNKDVDVIIIKKNMYENFIKRFAECIESQKPNVFVDPKWIFECHQNQKLLPFDDYLIEDS